MKDYLKIITAQESAVSFLPKNVTAQFGFAQKIAVKLCENYNKILIFCTDQGYFTLGKSVKDELLSSNLLVTCFCLDKDCFTPKNVQKLLADESGADCVIVVGDDELALNFKKLLSSEFKLIFMPLSFDFGAFLQCEEVSNISLVFDDEVFASLSKNKLLSGVKSVLSKRITFIESAVYELIGGLLSEKEYLSLAVYAQECLLNYLSSRSLQSLIRAQFFASLAIGSLPIQNSPLSCASQIVDYEGLAEFGEREYMFYQMLLKIYSLYQNNDTDFLVKLPCPIDCFLEGNNQISNLPEFVFDGQRLAECKRAVKDSERIKQSVNKYLAELESLEKVFYSIYAGRKYTVQNYNQKQRTSALKQAPLACAKISLLKLIWADGVLEYI